MSKRSAIAKAAGLESSDHAYEHPLLATRAVVDLTKHVVEAAVSASASKRARPSRSGCAQLALQILVVAAGLRRAALVDSIGLSVEQASAVSSRLASLGKRKETLDGSEDLQQVRLLFHAPTSQTFILSRRESLWTDLLARPDGCLRHRKEATLWIDARLTSEHLSPTLCSPDMHVSSLFAAIRRAILEDDSHDVLVVSQASTFQTSSSTGLGNDAQTVGVALAGLLLEYDAIYCIHDLSASDVSAQDIYNVRPLGSLQEPPSEPAFSASPANCLGMHPLLLFQISWSDSAGRSFELLSFSIPQLAIGDSEERRNSLTNVFQGRVSKVSSSSIFAQGSIGVHVSQVTLNQVAL